MDSDNADLIKVFAKTLSGNQYAVEISKDVRLKNGFEKAATDFHTIAASATLLSSNLGHNPLIHLSNALFYSTGYYWRAEEAVGSS